MSEVIRLGKVYYWIKKSKSFYEYIGVKKLFVKAQASVYQALYIYERLLLHSASTDGYLYFEGYEECFVDEIALILELDTNAVRMTMLLLFDCKLIEQIEDDVFYLPQLAELVAKEGESANRVRRHREKRKELEEKRYNVTEERYIVQNCNTEIDIDKQKEKELQLHTDIEAEACRNYAGEKKNVILLEREYQKLCEMFPADCHERIDRLSRYLNSSGKNYDSHFATIIRWAKEDEERKKRTEKAAQNNTGSFDTDSFFEAALARTYNEG